jgi:3-methyladenine DNA glycosylase/8-oxoguanine DNA glycosylase
VGAQAAALLDAGMRGAPVGDVAAPWTPAGTRPLDVPPGFDLRRTALTHGGVGLAPCSWDGRRLHLRLPDPVAVAQTPDGVEVAWATQPPDEAELRTVLSLDEDLEPLWAACEAVPSLRWVRATGSGRLLRSPAVWQDVVGALAQVRSSYRGAQARMRSLVGDGAFPPAHEIVDGAAVPGWGFREPWLRSLAAAVADGAVDLERARDPCLPDHAVASALGALPGVGPFTVAQLLPLLGRPRPLVLDGWLREALGGAADGEVAARYAPLGRWAGTGAWLAALAPRLTAPS